MAGIGPGFPKEVSRLGVGDLYVDEITNGTGTATVSMLRGGTSVGVSGGANGGACGGANGGACGGAK